MAAPRQTKKTNGRIDEATVGRKLRALRRARGWTLRALAARADLAPSFLSKLEAGATSPSLGSLIKVLDALETPVTEFFAGEGAQDPSERVVFPAADMRALADGEKRWTYAFPAHPRLQTVLTFEEWQPRTRQLDWAVHPHDLCGYVLGGVLTLDLGARGVFRARRGDAFYVKAHQRHLPRNEGKTPLRLVCIELKPAPA